ncbi:MAG: hypothetical protein RIR10_212, partial [Planctomycetota bacterium]
MASWKFGHLGCATLGLKLALCAGLPASATSTSTAGTSTAGVSAFGISADEVRGNSTAASHHVGHSEPPERLILRVASSQQRVPRRLRPSVAVLEVDVDRLKVLARAGGGVIEEVPLGPFESVALRLRPLDPFEADAKIEVVDGNDPQSAAKSGGSAELKDNSSVQLDGIYLAGSVLDSNGIAIEGSHAFLAQSRAGTFGYIERPEGITIISSGPFGAGLPTVSYNLEALPEGAMHPPDWTCTTINPDEGSGEESEANGEGFRALSDGGLAGTAACRQIRIAYDTDTEFLQSFAGDQDAAAGYVATLSSALTSIFARDINARLSVSFVRFWSGNDPWNATGTGSQLAEFKSNWDAFMIPVQRDLAHLLSARTLGGGVAYLPGLCTTGQQAGSGAGAYAVSANLDGYFPTPLVDNDAQNWDIFVVAHELGHNFGAPHTHDYNPPLDGCGLSPQDCTAAVADEGTIMSYCHLCAGGMTNIRLRFHPSNIATMLARLDAISCNYTGVARPPIATDDRASTFTGVPVLVDVLANDLEFNCEAITIQSFSTTTFEGGTVTR